MIGRYNNGGVMSQKIIKLSPLFLAAAAAGFSTQAFSAGFSLFEQGASGQGVAYAGASAIGEDASTIYFNPAAMTRLSGQQIVLAGHIIVPTSEYTDSGQSSLPGGPPGSLTGPNSDGGSTGFIPNFYWAAKLENDLHVGVGVNVPYGLATEYDDGWVGRYHGLKSEITTININPSMAWKATDTVSLGFGLSFQYIDIELTNNIYSPAVCGALMSACNTAGDSHLKLEGDDMSIGWNVGVLWDITQKDRLGVAYRSEVKHDVTGDATYTMDDDLALQATLDATNAALAPFTVFTSTTLSAVASMPETFSVSYVRDFNDQWSLLADWTWTGWSSLDTVDIVLTGGAPGQDPGLDLAFANTNRYAVGAHYKPGNKWIFRGGLAYDESPVRSPELRSVRIPDNDRTWLSLGFGYQPSQSWSFDVGYSHLFVDDTEINNVSTASSNATLIGTYEASVDILSAGVNFNF
jgi:long-chain fatty acid transport protein